MGARAVPLTQLLDCPHQPGKKIKATADCLLVALVRDGNDVAVHLDDIQVVRAVVVVGDARNFHDGLKRSWSWRLDDVRKLFDDDWRSVALQC